MTIDLGVSSADLEQVLRAYVEDIPIPTALAACDRDDLVGEDGQLQPLGVVSGMVFAMVTRASYSARLTWFQSLDWSKVSRAARFPAESVRGRKRSNGLSFRFREDRGS